MPRELSRSLWGLLGGSSLPCRVRLGGCRVTGWGLAQVGEVKVGSWSRPSMWCVDGMGWGWGPDRSNKMSELFFLKSGVFSHLRKPSLFQIFYFRVSKLEISFQLYSL